MGTMRRRMVAVGLGVFGALVAGELALRIAAPAYAPRQPDYEIRHIDGSWTYRPGSSVEMAWDGDPYDTLPPGARQTIRINAEGLRGPLPKPLEPAVVVLGDSFTFGEGVVEDATIPALLQAELAENGPPAPAVVNAGVSAHGTVEEAARLPGLLARFRPRAVVLVHVPNDAIPWNEAKTRDQADLLEPSGPGGLRLLGLLRSVAAARELEEWHLSFYVGEKADVGAFSREALAAMARTCEQARVRFGVVAHPFLHRLEDAPLAAITDQVRGDCAALDVPFLDLLPALAGHDEHGLWVHPTDHHPNAAANRLSARAMAPFVRDLVR